MALLPSISTLTASTRLFTASLIVDDFENPRDMLHVSMHKLNVREPQRRIVDYDNYFTTSFFPVW